jgi:hypothetical protein
MCTTGRASLSVSKNGHPFAFRFIEDGCLLPIAEE